VTKSAARLERLDGVLRVTLDRPAALNALDAALAADLLAAARTATDDPSIRAVLLTGAGRAFCAGADLAPGALPIDRAASRGANTRRLLEELLNPVLLAWHEIPKPVVVAVNGVAAGGGVGLALCGDLLLMASSASLLQVFVPKLGLVPDLGCSDALPRALGPARAKALAMLGTPITAAQAVAWGLALEAVDDDALPERALALARQLAAGPTRAYAELKRLYDAPAGTLAGQLALEAAAQERLGDTADHAEGLAAFAARRVPVFRGE
jgi:2-(1,2-epoxy-1,2-dihydrophenyl)acetyl-CoA isomerase